MLLIAFVLQDQSRKQLSFASLQLRSQQAACAADAGLLVALRQLASNPGYQGTSQAQIIAEGPESYTTSILKPGAGMPDGQTVPSGYLFVISTGLSLGQARAQSGALVKVGSSGSKGLPGIYGSNVSLAGASFVDSYNSAKNGYLFRDKNGSILTNSSEPGSVTLTGASQVFGPVIIGPKGNLDPQNYGGTTMKSKFTVWRDWSTSYLSSSLQTTPKDLPPVKLPAAPGKTSVKMGWGSNTLAPGNYDQVIIGNAGSLTLKPGIYVMNQFTIQGGANIRVAGDGPVQIYIAKAFSLDNGAVMSDPGSKPSLLQVNLVEDASYDQRGGTQLTGVIYGPQARVNLSNGSTIYGSLIGDQVTLSGDAWVHYDESLKDFSLGDNSGSSGASGVTVFFRQRW